MKATSPLKLAFLLALLMSVASVNAEDGYSGLISEENKPLPNRPSTTQNQSAIRLEEMKEKAAAQREERLAAEKERRSARENAKKARERTEKKKSLVSYSLGAKSGDFKVGVDAYDDTSMSSFNLGIIGEKGFGVELEGGKASGDVDQKIITCCATKYTFNYEAIYGVFRSPDRAYAKAKIGALNERFEGESGTKLSFGLGGGFKLFDHLALELEGTVFDSEVSVYSLGLVLRNI